ncbi:helix-turn-helix domain-containing protein [Nocardia otitidiscaviarum]|uniref:helix-turn-helix domain-containing protein n=1 Tax=Nocardia otitidiscaviarum TaxID=1823 RepID=UPI001894D564|nr:helix-turn-helix transcriptional regulator [Nocardia otitidiscaviarum]MBF6181123.1 helix-turn-helix domain-containing protein [Nocardia otitidiscaviarum]
MLTGSTLARRALGRELKRLREAHGMNQSAAGRVIGVSPQTIGRMEDGLPTKVSDLYMNASCDAYSASAAQRAKLLDLALEVRITRKSGGGWWRAFADEMNAGFDHYLGLEEAAQSVSVWKLAVVPGLLQTPEYRRAIAWHEFPDKPTDQVEKRVELALRRQMRLEDPDFTVEVILSEMVLRDQIGGPAVMADQLRRLLDVGELPNVSVRVVPFNAASHLGSRVGSFVLLEFPKLQTTGLTEPPVVYVEEYAGDLYLEREPEILLYHNAFREIGRVALDQDATRQLILSVAKEYGE